MAKSNLAGKVLPTIIGDNVTVGGWCTAIFETEKWYWGWILFKCLELWLSFKWTGHSAVLHGCTVEDEAFVGMGATLLDGVYVEKHAMVAAGALVRQNTKIPCGEVCGWSISI